MLGSTVNIDDDSEYRRLQNTCTPKRWFSIVRMGLEINRVSWDLWKPSACNQRLQAKLLIRSWSSETTAYASSSLLSLVFLDVIDATSNCSFQFNNYTAYRGPDFVTIDEKSKIFNETRVAAFTAFEQFTKKVTKSTFSKEHIAEKH